MSDIESQGDMHYARRIRAAVAAAKGDDEKPRNWVPADPVPSWGELKKGRDAK